MKFNTYKGIDKNSKTLVVESGTPTTCPWNVPVDVLTIGSSPKAKVKAITKVANCRNILSNELHD